MHSRLLSIAVACALCAGAALAVANDWQLLGATSVPATPTGAKLQPGEIRLPSARGPFQSIRLSVDGAAVYIDRVVVTFAHGSKQHIELRKKLDPGDATRVIDLRGSDRVIREIDFTYRAAGFANVRLFARE